LVVCNVELHELEDFKAHSHGADTSAWPSGDGNHHLDSTVTHRSTVLFEDRTQVLEDAM